MNAEPLGQLIQYRCVRPDHLRAAGVERIFVHRGSWAYCPAGRTAPGHQLLPTGGVDRRRLEGGVGTQSRL